jgi:hypothetical protein
MGRGGHERGMTGGGKSDVVECAYEYEYEKEGATICILTPDS